jgi:hypothetical protein
MLQTRRHLLCGASGHGCGANDQRQAGPVPDEPGGELRAAEEGQRGSRGVQQAEGAGWRDGGGLGAAEAGSRPLAGPLPLGFGLLFELEVVLVRLDRLVQLAALLRAAPCRCFPPSIHFLQIILGDLIQQRRLSFDTMRRQTFWSVHLVCRWKCTTCSRLRSSCSSRNGSEDRDLVPGGSKRNGRVCSREGWVESTDGGRLFKLANWRAC